MKKRYLFIFLFLSLFFLIFLKYYTSFFVFTTRATQQGFSASVLVDTFPPDVIIDSPSNTTYNVTTIDLNFSITDSASGVNTSWYNLDNGDNATVTSNTTFTVNSKGDYTFYFFANDSVGLENNSEPVTFYVDYNKTVLFSEFTGHLTTNFSAFSDEALEDLSGVVLHVPDSGVIEFLDDINVSGLLTDLDTYVGISNNSISLDATNLASFNKNARLRLYNLSFTNPRILKDGSVCPASICSKESYSNNMLTFTVTGFSAYSAEETPAEQPSTPGGGAGGGGGGGGGGGVSTYTDFSVNPHIIKVELRPGETDSKKITVKNTGDKPLQLNLKLSVKGAFALLSKDSLVLGAGEEEEVGLLFDVPNDLEPGVYTGNVVVESQDIRKQVAIVIEVESGKKLFDMKLDVLPEYKVVYPGDSVYSVIELFNMGTVGRVDVNLTYGIKDMDDNLVVSESGVVSVETRMSVVKHLVLPKGLSKGAYVMFAEAHYEGTVATATSEFEVVPEEPVKLAYLGAYKVVGWAIAAIAALLLLLLMHRMVEMLLRMRVKKSRRKRPRKPRGELVKSRLDRQEKLVEDLRMSGLISREDYLKNKRRISKLRNR